MRRRFCLMMLFCAIGCSPSVPGALPLYPVTGTLKVDGKPLEEIVVQLIPVDEMSKVKPGVGKTDKEGNFKILTNGDRGAAAGSYKVVLGGGAAGEQSNKPLTIEEQAKKSGEFMATQGPSAPKYPFPQEWASAKSSPKTFEVQKQSNTLTLDL